MLPHPARPLLGLALVAAAACSAPPDPQLTRPGAVRTTPYEQHDLVLGAWGALRLRYIDVGPQDESAVGQIPLLLVPGHTSRIEEFDALLPVLSRSRRVLVFDYPGSGYSDKPERYYDVAFYEAISLAFLDALGVQRAYLSGGSLGGNLTLRLGYAHPERFPRLAPWAPAGAWTTRPWLARLVRHVAGYPLFWPLVRVESTYWYAEDWPGREAALADTFAYYREVLSPGFVLMFFGLSADVLAHSLFAIAPEIHQPVWLGWGDQDDGAGMGEGVAELHALLPDSRLRVYPGARHALAAEVPDALAHDIDAFLREGS